MIHYSAKAKALHIIGNRKTNLKYLPIKYLISNTCVYPKYKFSYMHFLKKLLRPKKELSFSEKEQAFLDALLAIEKKYFLYFNSKLDGLAAGLPHPFRNYYFLHREFEYVRFDYNRDLELPQHIKVDCDTAYQDIWGNR